jgi:hypothetical protein
MFYTWAHSWRPIGGWVLERGVLLDLSSGTALALSWLSTRITESAQGASKQRLAKTTDGE